MTNRKIIEITRNPPHVHFPILWNIGKRCNYSCFYCHPKIHDNYSKHVDLKTMKYVIDRLAEIHDLIRIWFTGGEPTSNPNFHKLIYYIREKYGNRFLLGVTTNGTRPEKYYLDLAKHMAITFSCHFEYIHDTIEPYAQKIINTQNNTSHGVSVNIMLEPDYWNEIKALIDIFDKNGNIKYDLMKIHGGHVEYTDTQLKYIASFKKEGTYQDLRVIYNNNEVEEMNSNQFTNRGLHQLKGWNCDIGKSSLYIENTGNVKRGSCGVGGYLGNIFTEFTIPNDSVLCNKEECNCIADLRIRKWKNEINQ